MDTPQNPRRSLVAGRASSTDRHSGIARGLQGVVLGD
jgi:hypothetical protein